MTPLLLNILIHYYCRADDFRDGDFSAPAVREGIDWLRDEVNLIEHRPPTGSSSNMYQTTERGTAFVEALLKTPLPVQKWVMPERQP